MYSIGCCASPLPGRSAVDGALVPFRGATSSSAGPSAGTSGAVNRSSIVISGAADDDLVFAVPWPEAGASPMKSARSVKVARVGYRIRVSLNCGFGKDDHE